MDGVLNNLVWIGRKVSNHGKHGSDIHITTNLTDGKRDYVNFTFKNDSWKKFAEGSEYFEVSFYKNRLFLRKSDAKNGLLILTNKNCKTEIRYAKIQCRETPRLFVGLDGDYELMHDDFYDLYYIERKDEQ